MIIYGKNDDDKNTKFKALTFETLKYNDSWNVIKKTIRTEI